MEFIHADKFGGIMLLMLIFLILNYLAIQLSKHHLKVHFLTAPTIAIITGMLFGLILL
jgi:uncharacterized membrane protein YadS